jgi:hypothetical protein
VDPVKFATPPPLHFSESFVFGSTCPAAASAPPPPRHGVRRGRQVRSSSNQPRQQRTGSIALGEEESSTNQPCRPETMAKRCRTCLIPAPFDLGRNQKSVVGRDPEDRQRRGQTVGRSLIRPAACWVGTVGREVGFQTQDPRHCRVC